MSDDGQLNQDEIDALLKGDASSKPPAPKAPSGGAAHARPAAPPQPEDALMGQDDIDALLQAMGGGGIPSGAEPAPASSPGGAPTATLTLPEVSLRAEGAAPRAQVDLLKDVHVKVRVELGRGKMVLRDILRLTHGSVVELEKLAGDPLDIYVNERLIAKGEVLVLNENFCIRITEIFSPEEVLRLRN